MRSGVVREAVGSGPRLPWRDRILLYRDTLLASPWFQRWAVSFPLTRPIARARTRALFDLCAGFVYAQVLQACVRLRLLESLADGPATVTELAARLSMPVDGMARLLAAAASLRLLEQRGQDRYGLGPLGAAMLGNPAIAAMVEHHRMLYADLSDPVALLRGEAGRTELARYWAYAGEGAPSALPPEKVAAYSALMAASQPLVAAEILDAYPLHRHRCLLDLGGGEGAFLREVAARVPDLRLMLFDLPAVAERARRQLGERATVIGGDFLNDPLPQGADIVSLVRVIHDHDEAAALAILKAAHRALPPGGTLLLAEPMSGTPGALPVGEAYFGFYLLAMGSGRSRTPAELQDLLHRAGFAGCRLLRTRNPLLTRVIVARAALL